MKVISLIALLAGLIAAVLYQTGTVVLSAPKSGPPITIVDNLMIPENPLSRTVVRLADLELIGGWRVPPAWQPDWKSLAFTNGGLAVRFGEPSIQFYLTHHNHLGGPIQELVADRPQGDPESPSESWPLLKQGSFLGDLYWPARKANEKETPPACTGLFWDEEQNLLLTTGRAEYAAPPPQGPFLCSADISNPIHPNVDGPYAISFGSAQLLGGGMCEIPEWFASRYLDGKSLGVGFGGYCSGQGSSHGPSLAATSHQLTYQKSPAIPLLAYGLLGEKDPAKREQRPPDYSDAKSVWSIDPNGNTGYWAADRVTAGPVWIETPTKHGVCYWTIQGCGTLDYKRQTETFGETTNDRVYIYDPATLADVAQGTKTTYEPRAAYADWTKPVPGSVRGAVWHHRSQTLFLLHTMSWKSGDEKLPVIAAYKIRSTDSL